MTTGIMHVTDVLFQHYNDFVQLSSCYWYLKVRIYRTRSFPASFEKFYLCDHCAHTLQGSDLARDTQYWPSRMKFVLL